MLTGFGGVDRLVPSKAFMFASLGEVDGKSITAMLGRDKRRKAGVIPGLFYCFTSLLICQIPVSSLFFVSLSLTLLKFFGPLVLAFSWLTAIVIIALSSQAYNRLAVTLRVTASARGSPSTPGARAHVLNSFGARSPQIPFSHVPST